LAALSTELPPIRAEWIQTTGLQISVNPINNKAAKPTAMSSEKVAIV